MILDNLTDEQANLLNICMAAHHRSVFRGNISSQTVVNAFAGSNNYVQSICAGMLTLGYLHGPIEQTTGFLSNEDPASLVQDMVERMQLVPGWGNGFEKGHDDPLWEEVHKALPEEIRTKLDAVTARLHELGRKVYPNPSAYTAATAIVLGIPAKVAMLLLFSGRLRGWTELILGAK